MLLILGYIFLPKTSRFPCDGSYLLGRVVGELRTTWQSRLTRGGSSPAAQDWAGLRASEGGNGAGARRRPSDGVAAGDGELSPLSTAGRGGFSPPVLPRGSPREVLVDPFLDLAGELRHRPHELVAGRPGARSRGRRGAPCGAFRSPRTRAAGRFVEPHPDRHGDAERAIRRADEERVSEVVRGPGPSHHAGIGKSARSWMY